MRTSFALLLSLALVVACGGDGTSIGPAGDSSISIFPLEVGADTIACGSETVTTGTLTITDSSGPTEYTLTPVDGTITFAETYEIFFGTGIVVTLDLKNADGDILYSGSDVVDVAQGQNVPLVIRLYPNREHCGDDVPSSSLSLDAIYATGAYPGDLYIHYAFDDDRSTTDLASSAEDSWINDVDGVYSGEVTNQTDGGITYADFNMDCASACATEMASVLIPRSSMSTHSWTWMGWIALGNVEAGSAPSRQVLIDGPETPTDTDAALRIELVESGTDGSYDAVFVIMQGRESTIELPTGTTLDIDDGWYHLVVVHHIDDYTVYLNGWAIATHEESLACSSVFQMDTVDGFYLGHRWDTPSDPDMRFTGFMDDVKFWERGLYAGEVHDEYVISRNVHGHSGPI